MARDFAAEAGAIRARLVETNLFFIAHELRRLEESWARHLVRAGAKGDIATVMRRIVKAGVDPVAARQAAEHLTEAEKWQQQIGTFATSGAEGMMSMGELRSLQLAHAWLAAALSRQSEPQSARNDATTAKDRAAQAKLARRLAAAVASDTKDARRIRSLRELGAMVDDRR